MSYLQPKVLPKVLEQVITSGVTTSLLLNIDGTLLASAGDTQNDKLIGAIIASIWESYQKASKTTFQEDEDKTGGKRPSKDEKRKDDEPLSCVLIDCEQGKIAAVNVTQKILACVCGDSKVELGMLKAKAEAVAKHLRKPFEQVQYDEVYA